MQDGGIFLDKAVQPFSQQTHHLSFGDLDPDIVHKRRQALGRNLTLSMQHQAEPPQIGAIATDNAGGQGRKPTQRGA